MSKATKTVCVSGTVEISVQIKGVSEDTAKEMVLDAIGAALSELKGLEGEPHFEEYQLDVEQE